MHGLSLVVAVYHHKTSWAYKCTCRHLLFPLLERWSSPWRLCWSWRSLLTELVLSSVLADWGGLLLGRVERLSSAPHLIFQQSSWSLFSWGRQAEDHEERHQVVFRCSTVSCLLTSLAEANRISQLGIKGQVFTLCFPGGDLLSAYLQVEVRTSA